MAVFTRYILSITVKDGVKRDSVISYYIKPAEAKLYFAAADQAAREASAVGVLADAAQAMTGANRVSVAVSIEDVTDPVALPDVTVLRGNKLAFSVRSGGRGLVTTIPARIPATFEQGVDSLNVALDTPDEMAQFVTEFDNHVVDQFGNAAEIQDGRVVD